MINKANDSCISEQFTSSVGTIVLFRLRMMTVNVQFYGEYLSFFLYAKNTRTLIPRTRRITKTTMTTLSSLIWSSFPANLSKPVQTKTKNIIYILLDGTRTCLKCWKKSHIDCYKICWVNHCFKSRVEVINIFKT